MWICCCGYATEHIVYLEWYCIIKIKFIMLKLCDFVSIPTLTSIPLLNFLLNTNMTCASRICASQKPSGISPRMARFFTVYVLLKISS